MEACAQHPYILIGAVIGYSVLEYWLGKTERVRAASALELVIMMATLLATFAVMKLRRKNGK